MNETLYSSATVKRLFAEMSATYGLVNLVASFGFAWRWRRQCVERASIESGHTVYDLMTGMGECLPSIRRRAGREATLRALDFCPEMCERARKTARRVGLLEAQGVLEEDVLACSLESSTADRVVCSFGLKTLDPQDLGALAREVRRLLRPGGRFSFVEISEPRSRALRVFYLPYIRYLVPFIGRCFLGNPDNYRQLGVYTQAFGSCVRAREAFEAAGLRAREFSLFFGCATGLEGEKPDGDDRDGGVNRDAM